MGIEPGLMQVSDAVTERVVGRRAILVDESDVAKGADQSEDGRLRQVEGVGDLGKSQRPSRTAEDAKYSCCTLDRSDGPRHMFDVSAHVVARTVARSTMSNERP